jgi:7-alpha-hydroxysteroid dehydrogenase
VYLASPAAAWVTGTMLDVNGGAVDELQNMFPDLEPSSVEDARRKAGAQNE